MLRLHQRFEKCLVKKGKCEKGKCKKSIDILLNMCIINIRWTNKTAEQVTLMRIGVMAAQQTLTLLVEVRVLYP